MRRRVKVCAILVLLLTGSVSFFYGWAGNSAQEGQAQALTSTYSPTMEPPALAWNRTYGAGNWNGDRAAKAYSLIQTDEGGYAIATVYNGTIFLGKIDSSGNMQWNQTYGYGGAVSVVQTLDGGYVLCCNLGIGPEGVIYSGSINRGVNAAAIALIKVNASGYPLWNHTLIEQSNQQAFSLAATSMIKTADAGYAISGYINNPDSVHRKHDFLLIKANSEGELQWVKTYGGAGNDEATAVVQTADGGFALAGYTSSFGPYNNNFWLVKTDSTGDLQWAKAYGKDGLGHKVGQGYINGNDEYGLGDNKAYSVIQTNDGGYVLVGYTGFDWGKHSWIVKTDSNGNPQWNQTYGAWDEWTFAYSVIQIGDGGFAIASTNRTNLTNGCYQIVLTKTDSSGHIQWDQTYENIDTTTKYPYATSVEPCMIIQTKDGGIAILGNASPMRGGLTPYFYLLKTSSFLSPPLSPPSFTPSSNVHTHVAFPTITIQADGSVTPATAPVDRSGNIYTFTANFSGSLVITKDNVVVDGAGYTLHGNGSIKESDGSTTFIQFSETGIFLNSRNHVEIKNLKVIDYFSAILFNGTCSNNFIHGNTLIGSIGAGILRLCQNFPLVVSEGTKSKYLLL